MNRPPLETKSPLPPHIQGCFFFFVGPSWPPEHIPNIECGGEGGLTHVPVNSGVLQYLLLLQSKCLPFNGPRVSARLYRPSDFAMGSSPEIISTTPLPWPLGRLFALAANTCLSSCPPIFAPGGQPVKAFLGRGTEDWSTSTSFISAARNHGRPTLVARRANTMLDPAMPIPWQGPS